MIVEWDAEACSHMNCWGPQRIAAKGSLSSPAADEQRAGAGASGSTGRGSGAARGLIA